MPKQTAQHTQAVTDYYNNTRAEYRFIWRNRHNLGIHFGYYDREHMTHDAAVLNLNAQLAKRVNITKGDRVLDAGCGVGGSAIWLAQNVGCKATGINITPRQVQRAKENAANRNVSDLTDFLVADFADIPFGAKSFSVFWGLESIVHAENKQAVLNEAYRVLRPGGRLVIAEYLVPECELNSEEKTLLDTWLRGWEMPGLESPKTYRQMLKKAGFRDIQIDDWTEHMMPSFRRLGSFSKRFKPVAPLLSLLGLANQNQRRNLEAAEAQIRLLETGAWSYRVVTATKLKQ